ncbi:MAG: hypothetical protein M3139_03120 [Bacteroidota bacterium]|nr:hypothetical protein [Bacteroidota bacterium]
MPAYARVGTPTLIEIPNEKHNTSIVALDKEMELKKILSQKKIAFDIDVFTKNKLEVSIVQTTILYPL